MNYMIEVIQRLHKDLIGSFRCSNVFEDLCNIRLHKKQIRRLSNNTEDQVTPNDRHELLTTSPTWKPKIY